MSEEITPVTPAPKPIPAITENPITHPSVSPTGVPLVPPAVAKWLAIAYAVLAAAEGALAVTLGTEHVAVKIIFVVLALVSPLLGIASPGLRRAALPLLLVGAIGFSGCALFQRSERAVNIAGPKVMNCVKAQIEGSFPTLLADMSVELSKALSGREDNVETIIQNLLSSAKSELVPCAIREILVAWQQAGPGAGYPMPAKLEDQQKLLLTSHRGQAFLLEQGYLFQ